MLVITRLDRVIHALLQSLWHYKKGVDSVVPKARHPRDVKHGHDGCVLVG